MPGGHKVEGREAAVDSMISRFQPGSLVFDLPLCARVFVARAGERCALMPLPVGRFQVPDRALVAYRVFFGAAEAAGIRGRSDR